MPRAVHRSSCGQGRLDRACRVVAHHGENTNAPTAAMMSNAPGTLPTTPSIPSSYTPASNVSFTPSSPTPSPSRSSSPAPSSLSLLSSPPPPPKSCEQERRAERRVRERRTEQANLARGREAARRRSARVCRRDQQRQFVALQVSRWVSYVEIFRRSVKPDRYITILRRRRSAMRRRNPARRDARG